MAALALTAPTQVAAAECLLDTDGDGTASAGDTDGGAVSDGTADTLACGTAATATGANSTAVGSQASATGEASTAIGSNYVDPDPANNLAAATASGGGSIAV
jgi:hypothetical protein